MAHTITNISTAPQGVRTSRGIVFVKPGKTRTLEVRNIAAVRATGAFEIAELDAAVPEPPAELVEKVKAAAPRKPARRTPRKRNAKATK